MSPALRLTGLLPAAYSPLAQDGRLRLEVIDLMADLFAEVEVGGVFVGGTTGECHSLTVDERKQLTERWVEAADGRFPVVVHVGSNCLPHAQELAAHAADAGAAALAVMAPSFFRPRNVADLVDYCRDVASAANAPFYYYDIPNMTGVSLRMDHFLEAAARQIPTFNGLKYTNPDLMTLQTCLHFDNGAYDILFGCDEILLTGLALGAQGAIGSTYNYAAPVYQRVMRAMQQGDLPAARRAQLEAVELIRAQQEFGVIAAGKAIMNMMGIPCGPTRSPLHALSCEESRQLYERVRHLDVFLRPLTAPAAAANFTVHG